LKMHYGLPDPISRLIESLSKLPGIGEKNATRLAFHLLRSPKEFAEDIAKAIVDAKTKVSICPICFSFMAGDNCSICTDQKRDKSVICVVEEPFDLLAIERSREHRGQYHVLNGVISPIEGVGPDDLKIKELIDRLKTEPITEVIIATNPSVEGEATALYLAKIIKPIGIEITRIAYGIPVGGDIGYVDEITLGKALKDRKKI
jgi:recombination protein RecR